MTHVVNDVLEPPALDDLPVIDLADRVVRHQAGLVRPVRPRLLVVHDVRDLVVVRPGAVLLDMVAPGVQRLHLVVRQDRGVRMHDRMVVEFALVADRGEDVALQERRVVQHHQRLVRVAGEDHRVEPLLRAVLVLNHDVGRPPVHLTDGSVEVDLVPETRRQLLVDPPGALVPRLHRRRDFDVEELEVLREERGGHVEHVRRHQEIDEHRLQDLVPEVPGEAGQVQHRSHADVVEWIEGVQELRARIREPPEAVQHAQDALELPDLVLQLLSDVRIEIVGVRPPRDISRCS